MSAIVRWMDRRGAGCVRGFTAEADLARFVSKLRREAVIERDGRKIGEVYRTNGESDDRRVKWHWSFERWESDPSDRRLIRGGK